MTRFFIVCALSLLALPASARPLPLVSATPMPPPIGRENPLRPIRFFWSELDAQRVNQGILGRKNATRDEQRVAETPSLAPRPLSSW